jgi:SAM-dependent methyltransferase
MSLELKRTYFNELANRWDHMPAPPDAPEKVARFVRFAVPAAARLILDVGCGTGILRPHLGAVVAPTLLVELDLAELMLAENRAKGGQPDVAYVCGDAQRPPFRGGTFDAVLCFNALPHIPPLETTLRRLLDCLRPGGIFSVGHLMGSDTLNGFHASLGGPVREDHLPTAPRLAALCEEAGAEVFHQQEAPDWYLVQARKRA